MTDKQKEQLRLANAQKRNASAKRATSGVSNKSSDSEVADKSKANWISEKYDPLYVPDVFKKTRLEKVGDQSKVLSKLQKLMKDIRQKETQM